MLSNPSEFNLNEDEAAYKLGITKDLLFAYIKYAPKKRLGHIRKLNTKKVGRQWKFSLKDLEEWDAYLNEPWSKQGEKKPEIPSYIQDYLKVESGGQCAKCKKGHSLENAHIDDYSISFSHHHNIIRLCTECHDGDTYKTIPKEGGFP